MNSNEITVEILVPEKKCGAIIGKGGEIIRKLQENSGTKMHLIKQSSYAPKNQDRPLHITGHPDKVEIAKLMINQVLESENNRISNGANKMGQDQVGKFTVPSTAVGGSSLLESHKVLHEFKAKVDRAAAIMDEMVRQSNAGTQQGAQIHEVNQLGPINSYGQQMFYQNSGFIQPVAYDQSSFGSSQPLPTQQQYPISQQQHAGQIQPSINPATGHPDYSAQWIEYYRSIGKDEHAAEIEKLRIKKSDE